VILFYPLLIAVTGGLSAFLLAISFIPAKNPLSSRIEKMQGVSERVHSVRLAKFEEIVSGEKTGTLRARLQEAGWYHVTPGAFALRCLAGIGFGLCLGIVLQVFLPVGALGTAVGGLMALIGWRMPKIALDRAIKARKAQIDRALPDFLDLLSATVQAGLALNAAMIQAAKAAVGPLRDELSNALAEIQLGRSRSEALRSMADRVNEQQVQTMVTAIIQAETLGGNVSAMLRELAEDCRSRRWMAAEERAAKLPVMMLFPMALLMFPALYVSIFGPVLASVINK
jgi:tight adherence protein C